MKADWTFEIEMSHQTTVVSCNTDKKKVNLLYYSIHVCISCIIISTMDGLYQISNLIKKVF